MKTGSFWIGGKHAVLSAIKNPKRKINKLIITQENQKDFNPKDLNKKILIEVKDKKEIKFLLTKILFIRELPLK
jgi:tRNA G18 (ribose-2'-O)-methylase SpoU